MYTQSEITIRVINIFDYLKTNGMVGSQAQFCKLIGFHTVSFAHVKNGKRDFPNGLLQNLCDAYNVNVEFLLKGRGEMFIDGNPPVKPIKDIKGAGKTDSIERIWTKDLNVSENKDGIIVSYTDLDGKKKIVEFVRQ